MRSFWQWLRASVCSFVSANVMKATYGHEIESDEDKFLQLAIGTVRALSSNPAGGTDIVDFFPFCTFLSSTKSLLFLMSSHCYLMSSVLLAFMVPRSRIQEKGSIRKKAPARFT